MDNEVRTGATTFFDEFVMAFKSFDGNEIAKRYLSPYMSMGADKAINLFQSEQEIASYFQRIVNDYRAKGVRSCRYKDLEVTSIGRLGALGTVTWELLDADGAVVSSWRESYNLLHTDGKLKVYASTDHVN